MSDDELRAWAAAHPGMPQAVALLRLLGDNERLVRDNARLGEVVRTQLADAMQQRDEARAEAARLKAAVAEHHRQRADDRCVEDDDKLYAAAGLPPCDRRVGDKAAMLRNCERFIDRRCEGGGWPTYAELEAENERLRTELTGHEKAAAFAYLPCFEPDPARPGCWRLTAVGRAGLDENLALLAGKAGGT